MGGTCKAWNQKKPEGEKQCNAPFGSYKEKLGNLPKSGATSPVNEYLDMALADCRSLCCSAHWWVMWMIANWRIENGLLWPAAITSCAFLKGCLLQSSLFSVDGVWLSHSWQSGWCSLWLGKYGCCCMTKFPLGGEHRLLPLQHSISRGTVP